VKERVGERACEWTIDQLRSWLRAYVARVLKSNADLIDMEVTLDDLGLDSLAIAGLIGDLEKQTGVKLSPRVALQQPTIAALSSHVVAIRSASA
jgi:polyketide synthase 13